MKQRIRERVQLGIAARGKQGLGYLRYSNGLLVRVPFVLADALGDRRRATIYAGIASALALAKDRGVRQFDLAVENCSLTPDLLREEPVPTPFSYPFVQIRCALNALGASLFRVGGDELSRRAASELNVPRAA